MPRLNVNNPKDQTKKAPTTKRGVATNSKVELTSYLSQLKVLKPQFDTLKRQIEETTTKVKELMQQQKLDYYSNDGYFLKLSKSVQNSFDEEKIIKWSIDNKKGITKTKTLLDEEALENAVFMGDIALVELVPFQVEKITYRLLQGEEKGV